MNVNEMITELTQRLEDIGGTEFTQVMKIDALNNAQDRLVSLLDNKFLTGLYCFVSVVILFIFLVR